MLDMLRGWIERRRSIRRRWQADARRLVRIDERGAYYAAQRLAARARANGVTGEFVHWTKVAAEVARISPHAEMKLATVQAIVDEELQRGRTDGDCLKRLASPKPAQAATGKFLARPIVR